MSRERKRRDKYFKRRAAEKEIGRRHSSLVASDDPKRIVFSRDRATDLQAVYDWVRKGYEGQPMSHHDIGTFRLYFDFEERVIFEDDYLLVLDKPVAVNAHYSQGSPFGVMEVARLRRESQELQLVHRLDRYTTGVLLMAKGDEATYALREQFADKDGSGIVKKYLTFLEGEVEGPTLDVGVGIAATANSDRMSIVYPEKTHSDALLETEKSSHTRFTPKIVMANPDDHTVTTFTEVDLITGRSHQIRVIAADYLEHPVVGDRYYGASPSRFTNIPLLHASLLRINHPVHGTELPPLVAPVPTTFRNFASSHDWKYFTPDSVSL